MKYGRILCGAAAALTVLSSTAIAAQAEQTQLKLLTAPLGEVYGANSLTNLDGGYFLSDNGKFFKIGEGELAKWRETGKFGFASVESDLNTADLEVWSGGLKDGYVQFSKRDADGNVTERYVVHLDEASGRISTVYTLPADWSYTKSNGYSLSFDKTASELSINVYDPSGKKTTAVLSYTGDGEFWYSGGSFQGGENIGYVMFTTKRYAPTEDYELDSYDFEIHMIKKNGELELKHKSETPFIYFGYNGGMENAFMWGESNAPTASTPSYIYSIEENKKYSVGQYFQHGTYGSADFWYISSFTRLYDKLYGTKAIIQGTYYVNEQSQTGYVLVNLRDNDDADVISNRYSYMSTKDGKIYLVQTEDGKWGYMDDNGKEIATFDDASEFIGDYAPVVKNGKGYLIDRNMNKVSDEIDADGVTTVSRGLFRFHNGDNITLVTYAKADDTSKPNDTSSTTASETSGTISSETSSTTSSETSSSTSSSDTSSANNPATGITMAMIPFAVIGGAAVIAAKKKRK